MKAIATLLICFIIGITQAQIAEKQEDVCPLLIGEKVPNVTITNTKGELIETNTIFNKKTVLVFYRGEWCPYCNAQLEGLQKIEAEILKLGYQIIAVSPDAPSFLQESTEKHQLKYQLFSDDEGQLTQAMGLAYKKTNPKLEQYTTAKNPGFLPVPAIYVLDENQTVQFLYASPDFATRLKTKMLISVLRAL